MLDELQTHMISTTGSSSGSVRSCRPSRVREGGSEPVKLLCERSLSAARRK